jgi:hypothetical protein
MLFVHEAVCRVLPVPVSEILLQGSAQTHNDEANRDGHTKEYKETTGIDMISCSSFPVFSPPGALRASGLTTHNPSERWVAASPLYPFYLTLASSNVLLAG